MHLLRQLFLLSVIVGMAVAGIDRDVPNDDDVVLTRVLPAALPSGVCASDYVPAPLPPEEPAIADAEGPEAELAEIAALRRAPANRGVVRAGQRDYMRRR